MAKTIGNPLSWLSSATSRAADEIDDGVGELAGTDTKPIMVNKLAISDLRASIRAGTLFVGLIVVLPVMGHASWHFYRRAVAKSEN